MVFVNGVMLLILIRQEDEDGVMDAVCTALPCINIRGRLAETKEAVLVVETNAVSLFHQKTH